MVVFKVRRERERERTNFFVNLWLIQSMIGSLGRLSLSIPGTKTAFKNKSVQNSRNINVIGLVKYIIYS